MTLSLTLQQSPLYTKCMHKYTFPKGFLWGTATSAYQIEGNNKNSDWWLWEHRNRLKDSKFPGIDKKQWPLEPSLEACDSYHRYKEDFDLAAELNNNAIRFGVEWARIEPAPGMFDQKELDHYKKVIKAAKDRGLKTFVTLHHFTNPVWLYNRGGWLSMQTPKLFARYAGKCAEEFGDLVDVYLTINEPQVYSVLSFLLGRWVPQSVNPIKVDMAQINMIRAHNQAYKAIKKAGNHTVGIVKNIGWYEKSPDSHNPLDSVFAGLLRFLNNDYFLRPIKKNLDVLGLNYYFTSYVKYFNPRANPNDKVSDMGWWLEATGLKKVLKSLKKYNLPIYITENGLADAKDKHRTKYIKAILGQCAEALEEGVPLRGYFHWSLLDNYEWAEGFWPRFGLVEIDRENNLQRKPRPSFYEYAKICKSGTIIT